MIAALLAFGLALAEEPAAEVPDEKVQAPARAWRWGGIGIPTFNYNTTDGLGLGAGFELYERRADGETGYRYRLTFSTFWTTTGNYGSNYLQLEHRGRTWWVARFTWYVWRNMVYIGSGGDDVSVRNGEGALGNEVSGPSLMSTVVVPLRASPIRLWLQGYLRQATVVPEPGGILDGRQPLGADGGVYFDVSAGLSMQELDQWPVPHKGVRAEGSFRLGGTGAPGGFRPLAGVNLEVMAYWPLVGRRLVFGGRLLFDRTWGDRPFFEQEFLGGQLRDELAYDQMLTGYARSRTRGDGIGAAMLELRPWLGETGHSTVDISFYLSMYAETAFLMRGDRFGPHMPSVGVAPLLLWQGAVELRPFLAWGWMSDAPRGPRTPQMQVGISLLSPL